MYPDWDDESNVITRMVRRKFAFAREVAEYEELIEGEGQVRPAGATRSGAETRRRTVRIARRRFFQARERAVALYCTWRHH